MTYKEKIHQHCLQWLQIKADRLQAILQDLKNSGANETKSTSGDKHETALAILQIEQEQTRQQLKQVHEQQAVLNKIDPVVVSTRVAIGSFIKSTNGNFYLSTAIGKMIVDEIPVIAISPNAPLAQKLAGLKSGEATILNNMEYKVLSIE